MSAHPRPWSVRWRTYGGGVDAVLLQGTASNGVAPLISLHCGSRLIARPTHASRTRGISLVRLGHPTGQTATRKIALHGSLAHRSSSGVGIISSCWGQLTVRQPDPHRTFHCRQRSGIMNRIIWLVGAVVIVLFVLGYFGLR